MASAVYFRTSTQRHNRTQPFHEQKPLDMISLVRNAFVYNVMQIMQGSF